MDRRSLLPCLLSLLCACGSDAVRVLVRVTGDSGDADLLVRVALDGRAAAREETFRPIPAQFALSLPGGSRGRLTLEARTSPTERFDASGRYEGDLSGVADEEVTLALVRRPQRMFTVVVERRIEESALTAVGDVVSSPPGLSCPAGAGACRGDFPEGTAVELSPRLPADGPLYFAGWSGGCTGALPCQLSGAATVQAIFRPKVCSTPRIEDTGAAPWCWESPLPHGVGLRGAWASAESDIWAVGERGILQHFDGQLWRVLLRDGSFDKSHDLLAVAGSRRDDVWAVGTLGTALHFDGREWQERLPPDDRPTRRTLTAVWVSPAGTAWATRENGDVLRYFPEGWQVARALGAGRLPLAVTGTSDSDLWVVGKAGLAWHYDGAQWEERPSDVTLEAAYAPAAGELWAGGDGALRRYKGGAWEAGPTLPGSASYTLRGIAGDGGGGLWLVGSSGTLVPSSQAFGETRRDGLIVNLGAAGKELTVRREIAAPALTAVLSLPGKGAWAVGEHGVVLRTSGGPWARTLPVGPLDDLGDVWASRASDIWAVSRSPGAPLRRFDGATWSLVPVQSSGGLSRLSGSIDPITNKREMWASGPAGTLLRYHDDRWSEFQPPAIFAPALGGAWVRGPDDVWIVGERGTIVRMDGATPRVFALPPLGGAGPPDLLGVFSSRAGAALAVGTGACWRLSQVGERLDIAQEETTELPNALHYADAWGVSGDDIWVSSVEGALFHYTVEQTEQGPKAGWRSIYQIPIPLGSTARPPLGRIFGTDARDVWFVGGDGATVHWDGQAFRERRTPSRAELSGVWTGCRGGAIAVGASGTIMRYGRCQGG